MHRRAALAILTAASLATVGLGVAGAQSGGTTKLTLHPSGFGAHSYASWKAQQGETDDGGGANQALYFQKQTLTATNAAGVAVVRGLEGRPASDLSGLEWQHRNDGHCGAGAPRWNVTVSNMGMQRTVFLGCAAAAHSAGDEPGWTRDTYSGMALSAQFMPGDVIEGLAIIFDEGTDQGQGFVYLDNIKVSGNGFTKTWTRAADNSN
jgi:hypothetical protein